MPQRCCKTHSSCPPDQLIGNLDFDSPVANLSSEAPDLDNFIVDFPPWGPPPPNLGSNWTILSCLGLCESNVSLAEAQLCAYRNMLECLSNDCWGIGLNQCPPPEPPPPIDPPPGIVFPPNIPLIIPPNKPIKVFRNNPITCISKCPDGIGFAYTTPAGRWTADSQTRADQMALSEACRFAVTARICLGSLNDKGCLKSAYTGSTKATGGTTPFNFTVASGSLPPGLNISIGPDQRTLVIDGTPTAAGIYTFAIRATDANGLFMQKTYTITIGSAIDNCPLPDGNAESKYSQQLNAPGVGAGSTFTLVGGSLPAGLTLSSSGLVSGYPTVPGTSNFTVSVLDTNTGKTCEGPCSIRILPACGPLWSQIVWGPLQTLSGAPTGSAAGQQVTMGAAGTLDPVVPLVSNGQFHGTLNYNGPAAKVKIHISSVSSQPAAVGGATTFTLGILWGPNFNALLYDQPVVPPEVGPGTYDLVFNMPAGSGIITINVTCTAGTIGVPVGPCSVVGSFDLSNDCSP